MPRDVACMRIPKELLMQKDKRLELHTCDSYDTHMLDSNQDLDRKYREGLMQCSPSLPFHLVRSVLLVVVTGPFLIVLRIGLIYLLEMELITSSSVAQLLIRVCLTFFI